MKAKEVLEFVSKKIKVPLKDFPDGGFVIGSGNDTVRGILVSWRITSEVLKKAIKEKLNLIICHESFFYDEKKEGKLYCWINPDYKRKPEDWDKHPNNWFRDFVLKNKLTVLEIHYGLDRLIIYDAFMNFLGIKKVISGAGYEKIYELERPIKLEKLVSYVCKKMNLKCIRFVGKPDEVIRYVGNLWGGVSLSRNRYWMRRCIEEGADVIICGELDEDAMFFAKECRVCLIETSHVLSENIGIKEFAKMISLIFKNVAVKFYEQRLPYRIKL